ncbi:MAG: hypothetical protein IJZ32_05045 [Clostridia bacterium]|nr:hypothetical protein [Clostridia bacterium]
MHKLFSHLPKELTDTFAKTEISVEASEFYSQNREKARYMFGYPSYNYPLSPLTQYLLLEHYTSPFSNNCGDIEERGNYAIDTKAVEKRIVGLYAEKFGMGENFWGYITSGGSESNSCGITNAFLKNPHAILYYSAAAHYSVEKYARYYPRVEIPTLENDILDLNALFAEILKNYEATGAGANLVLTHGTTKCGACDDIDGIVKFLKNRNIPYFIHVDAALFGGIPNNQTNAPVLTDCKARGIHSVCVSLHKYVGFPDVHSVFVAVEKPDGQEIAYIGQHDTTVSGSRSFPAFALYNHIREQLNEPQTDLYSRNIEYFETALVKNGVWYYKAPRSNIFVIGCPSPEICKKYQLSTFDEDERGIPQRAHAIIFPSHRQKEMDELISDLKQ